MHGRGDFVIQPEPNLAALRGLALLGWLALWRCLLLGLFLCCHRIGDLSVEIVALRIIYFQDPPRTTSTTCHAKDKGIIRRIIFCE